MEKIEKIIKDPSVWEAFLQYKIAGGHLSWQEEQELADYVRNQSYMQEADDFLDGKPYPNPILKEINKHQNGKKRSVFVFPKNKNLFLKFIAFYLQEYDDIFAPNLCSFRRNICVKTAVKKLISVPKISGQFSYKADISDYFNSVNIEKLLPRLQTVLRDNEKLYLFLKDILSNPFAEKDGETVTIKKGIMAGVPFSAFLANLYLREMDAYFASKNALYLRYSDDIIVFDETAEKVGEHRKKILEFLHKNDLLVNAKKEVSAAPGEAWEFLGFSYFGGTIDIAPSAKNKLKQKMRRKAHALVRWKEKKGAAPQRAAKAFIRTFNNKFFSDRSGHDITWAKWYFPILSTAASLHEIDAYMQDCVRFIVQGNYSKKRYNLRYADMKEMGYKSLVNAYYAFKKKGEAYIL